MVTDTHAFPQARRILVVRYRFIGDTILTVPFLRNLRLSYPDAVIDVLVGPQSGTVLDGCPYIDETIVFDTTRFHKYDQAQGRPRSFASYVFQLRKRKYDLVFVLKRSLSAGILAWLTGARHRVGYDTQGRGFLLTTPVPWNDKIHEVESTLDVLRAAGIPIVDDHLECWVSDEEIQQVTAIAPQLNCDRRKVLIHPPAAHPDKVYPLEHWAQIVKSLFRNHNILPFYTGAQQDRSIYEELTKLSGIEGVNLAGRLTLRQSMAVYKQMDLAVCTDSGPAHLAAATGTPTIAIFGPTDPNRWRPWGPKHLAIFDSTLPCRPCNYHKICDDRPCLTQLQPEVIILQCNSILSTLHRPASTSHAIDAV